jgi:cell division cycle protein 37
MKRVVKQKYHIKSLLDFAEARARPACACARRCSLARRELLCARTRARANPSRLLALAGCATAAAAGKTNIRDVVRPFFTRLSSDAGVCAEYESTFEALYDKLYERAVEKRAEREAALREAEAAAAAEADEAQPLSREERLGPGGLDPVEVFESLPEELQKAYEDKDVDALRAFINGCPTAQARDIMRKMTGSGLWVPQPGEEGTLLREEEDDEEGEEAAEEAAGGAAGGAAAAAEAAR